MRTDGSSGQDILRYLRLTPIPPDGEALAAALGLHDHAGQAALAQRLSAMERAGTLRRDAQGAWHLKSSPGCQSGVVQGGRNSRSSGTVRLDDGRRWALSAEEMAVVFHGDEVMVKRVGGIARHEGSLPLATITALRCRHTTQLAGRCRLIGRTLTLEPDDPRNGHLQLQLSCGDNPPPPDGALVRTDVVTPPQPGRPGRCQLREVLGESRDAPTAASVAILNHQLRSEWPPEVLQEVAQLPAAPTAEDCARRVDLRQLPLVTIDGEDAKDYDDAVYCAAEADGSFRLWVAIADVCHYVRPNTALDAEAAVRGTSVYFPNRVLAMLPEALSNGLCSLLPESDRLCLACELQIDADGQLQDFSFCEGVMRSQARLRYGEVAAFLNSDGDGNHLPKGVGDSLRSLCALYRCLNATRQQRGAVDIDLPELALRIGDGEQVEGVDVRRRNDAHRLIEECMLCANIAAARLLRKEGLPTLYRVHDRPSDEALETLRNALRELNIRLGGGNSPDSGDFQRAVEKIDDPDLLEVVQTLLLQAMSRAAYQSENIGHFGLNYPEYTHFTSPIRRYPDLIVHRALRFLLRSQGGGSARHLRRETTATAIPRQQIYPYDAGTMQQLGGACSQAERRADEAVWDCEKQLVCEYLRGQLGAEFNGIVSGVIAGGLFVQLSGLPVSGFVPVRRLGGDYFRYDAARRALSAQRSNRHYTVGTRLRVQLAAVDPEQRRIDLEPVRIRQERASQRGHGRRRAWR